MKQRGVAMMFALAGALVLAGCQRAAQQPAQQPATTPEMQVVNVVAEEFAFEPKEVHVKAGMVRFLVKNEGSVDHEFMIEGVTEHAEHASTTFQPGVTHTVEVELKPGTYTISCNVAGHKEAGMVATLIAE